MRLHTNTIGYTQILRNALRAQQDAGRIARSVYFETSSHRKSRDHEFAFEIKLASDAKIDGDGRRWGNSGGYGATSQTTQSYSATYDEWGWLIAALYGFDPAARWGSANYPQYENAEHFHSRTGWSYNTDALLRALEEPSSPEDPYPFVSARTPEQAGRIGYGRMDAETTPSYVWRAAIATPGKRKGEWLHYMPRTADQVRAFAKLAESNALISTAAVNA